MLHNIEIITPKTKIEIEAYYQIRFDELRKPWNQPVGTEKDNLEDECVHRMIKINNIFAGVARLQYNNHRQAQIRYMAIKKKYQGQGLGRILVLDLEKIAKKNEISEIILQSRELAIKFYENLNYKVQKKTHLLFNDIQHFLMKKYL